MHWFSHSELSEDDFDRLRGTETMEHLQKNKLVIAYAPNQKHCDPFELGLYELTSPFHIRKINVETYEILFVDPQALDTTKEKLTMFKLAQQY